MKTVFYLAGETQCNEGASSILSVIELSPCEAERRNGIRKVVEAKKAAYFSRNPKPPQSDQSYVAWKKNFRIFIAEEIKPLVDEELDGPKIHYGINLGAKYEFGTILNALPQDAALLGQDSVIEYLMARFSRKLGERGYSLVTGKDLPADIDIEALEAKGKITDRKIYTPDIDFVGCVERSCIVEKGLFTYDIVFSRRLYRDPENPQTGLEQDSLILFEVSKRDISQVNFGIEIVGNRAYKDPSQVFKRSHKEGTDPLENLANRLHDLPRLKAETQVVEATGEIDKIIDLFDRVVKEGFDNFK